MEDIALVALSNEVVCETLMKYCSVRTKVAFGSTCRVLRSRCITHGPSAVDSGLLETPERLKLFLTFLRSDWCSKVTRVSIEIVDTVETKDDLECDIILPEVKNVEFMIELPCEGERASNASIHRLACMFPSVKTVTVEVSHWEGCCPKEWRQFKHFNFTLNPIRRQGYIDLSDSTVWRCIARSKSAKRMPEADTRVYELPSLFRDLTHVETLNVFASYDTFGSEPIKVLSHLTQLRELKFLPMRTVAGLGDDVENRCLEVLDTTFGIYKDSRIDNFKVLKDLRLRCVNGDSTLTIQDYPHLINQSLQRLTLYANSGVGALEGLSHFISVAYKNLRHLSIRGNFPRLSAKSVASLTTLEQLEELSLTNVQLDAPISRHMFSSLKTIQFEGCKWEGLAA